ncbi:TPA: hypothetical protein ACH3X3_006754 [Trebouxia sp. C0006]
MEIGRAARNPAAHRYQTARSFTSTLRTAGSPERSNDPGEWLKAGPSPRTLPTRRKEPDYAWAPRGHTHTHTDGLPTVVLEVAVFNETEEDLLAEGSEWLDLPTTQDEHGNKDPDQFKYTEIGKGSNCVQKGMQEFERAIPWTSFFHGFQDSLPQNVAGNNFTLDFFLLRREVVDVYKDTRLQNARIAALHANTTHAAAPKASQGSISFEGCIADRVKRWTLELEEHQRILQLNKDIADMGVHLHSRPS